MFRFTIRDVLWLTALVALGCGWGIDHIKNRIDWKGVQEQQRAYRVVQEELYVSRADAKAVREEKAAFVKAAARFGVTPLDIPPETKIKQSLLGPSRRELSRSKN
jgi:hypothetical protein